MNYCIYMVLAILGCSIISVTSIPPSDGEAEMDGRVFTGASGTCSSSSVYLIVNITHMLAQPDRLLVKVIGKKAEETNANIVSGKLPACLPKIDNVSNVAIFNFTYADCPTEPYASSNSSITYAYTIESVIDIRDLHQKDPNKVFRQNREFITIKCVVDTQTVSVDKFVADVVSSRAEIENSTNISLVTTLFRDGAFSPLIEPMPLSEWIYASVVFDGRKPDLFITPQDCRAHSGEAVEHYLIKAGCPVDPKTQILFLESNETLRKYYFRFQSFAFTARIGVPITITCTAAPYIIKNEAYEALTKCPMEAYFDPTMEMKKAPNNK